MKKWKQGEEMQSDKDYKCIQMHFRFDRHHANGLITAFGEKITHTPYTVCVCVCSVHIRVLVSFEHKMTDGAFECKQYTFIADRFYTCSHNANT